MASADATPRRRFLPQPVETSTRSTKRQHVDNSTEDSVAPSSNTEDQSLNMTKVTKPRKFLPQPVEETTRSSKKQNAEKDAVASSTNKESLPYSKSHYAHSDDSVHPGHPTSRPAPSGRRFAPEPVETTARTSRRKFAVEPVETSTRTSKEKSDADKPRRKFAPEPVEITSKAVRRRRRDPDEDSNESPPDSPSESSSRISSRQSTGSRRFSPELIETARGTFKKDPESPRSSFLHVPDAASPPRRASSKSPDLADPTESRFSAAALAKRSYEAHRQHSYCVPDLPMIESESSSDESEPPSLVDTPSSTDNEHQKLSKITESERESYTDYVLSLTTSQERKKLQEQVMAAYINEVPHEPVAHFGMDEEDEDEHVGILSAKDGADPQTFRRSSQTEHDWEMENMRRHHEQLEKAKKELQEDTAGASRFSAAALAARHHLGQVHRSPARAPKQKEEDAEYSRMKKAASPPMLGDDLVFPYTVSPKMTRCDVDQAPRPRRADSDDEERSIGSTTTQLWSVQSTSQSKPNAGLWMGSCQKPPEPSRPPTPVRSGLMTPAVESHNPFESRTPGRGTRTPARNQARPHSGMFLSPLTPQRSAGNSEDDFTSSIDKKLQLERQIEEEFSPRVITQVYNYLSLGFPTIAKDFDAELSKISRIPIKELRKDDHVSKGTIKGHVGTPEAEGTWEEDEDGTIHGCKRWEALRVYVKEWARQSPNFTVEQNLPVVQDPSLAHLKSVRAEAWGATARRGSWAQ